MLTSIPIEQLQNVVHLNKVGENEFEAVIKASESFSVCCGRNIAFISEIPGIDSNTSTNRELFALTWIDPVTTEIVKDANPTSAERKLMENFNTHRRRLGKQEKSSIHGTNGYLVPMPSSSELLGVAHFHRPENRDQSDYARHGHHYSKFHLFELPLYIIPYNIRSLTCTFALHSYFISTRFLYPGTEDGWK